MLALIDRMRGGRSRGQRRDNMSDWEVQTILLHLSSWNHVVEPLEMKRKASNTSCLPTTPPFLACWQ
jgi:hypothetical protein